MPPLGAGAYLLDVLFEVGPSRPAGMGGQVSISDLDLLAWQVNQGVDLSPWEVRTVKTLSREYAAMLSEATDANCPAPWTDKNLMTPERRQKIADAMMAWADNINAKTRR